MGDPFTKINAKEMALRSHAARKRNDELRRRQLIADTLAIAQLPAPAPPVNGNAKFIANLAAAEAEVLQELRDSSSASAKLDLARTLVSLGERWHMATGTPKPGHAKPAPRRHGPPANTGPLGLAGGVANSVPD